MAFPRTIRPAQVTPFRVLGGLVARGVTGKDQLRSVMAMGREWDEIWGPIRVGTLNVDELIAFIENSYNQMQTFDITHLISTGSGLPRRGVGGGTPLVNGASQVGSTLVTDGWTPSIANSVSVGDVFKITGLTPLFRIMATAASSAGGAISLSISPPIPAGMSPADNAGFTFSGCTLTAYISALSIPAAVPGRYMSGMRVTFREAL